MSGDRINFSSNQDISQRDQKVLVALLFLTICLLGGLYVSHQALNEEVSRQLDLQRSSNSQPYEATVLDKKLDRFLMESKANWAGLFSSFENTKTSNITLLGIEPQLTEQQVRFSGLAKDQEALNLYLTRLEATPALKQVELQRYRNTTLSPNGLEFFAVAKWSIYE
ncbi:hypothetical protein NQT62_04090 [Limnobacter humi]|uniref:Fimbrial assembly protein n=1 Tax=Limnobacter humi TaxID=1778671 RepID=A0ABT1WDM6_9BURK|nr:PilN domain-containing protein [Limnobacter humi]MCQ8895622.1 hypothetical protein [Limnobacter humi]